jgi:hypothetical protein
MDLQWASIISRDKKLTQKLHKHIHYHFMKEKNRKVDTLAREASSMPQGLLKKMGG